MDADIERFLGTIDRERLPAGAARRVSDGRVIELGRTWLRAGVPEERALRSQTDGPPCAGDLHARSERGPRVLAPVGPGP